MLGDRRRINMAISLLFSLPGIPMMIYGDEIGMGENLSLDGRNAVRTPMQWSSARHAGFSTAGQRALTMPIVTKGPFGYRHINVEKQVADPDSTLNVVKRLIRVRRQCPEWGWGTCRVLPTGEPGIFCHSCEWKGQRLIAVHNLADKAASVRFDREPGTTHISLLSGDSRSHGDPHRIEVPAYGYGWYRVEKT
jgi:maltose alpha-D-glucosyltransferase/alpha-amylase